MAGEAARSLAFDITWDIDDSLLVAANERTDDLRTSANDLFRSTDRANRSLSTSARTLASDFERSQDVVDETNSSIRDTRTEASRLDRGLGELADTSEDASDSIRTTADDLNRSISRTADEIRDTERQSERSHRNIQRDEERTGEEADDAAEKIKNIGKEAEDAGGKTSKLGGIMGGVGKVAKAGLFGAVAVVGATGAAALSAGKNYDEYFKTISIGTGASGEELNNLMESFKAVGRSGDDDLGVVAETLALVNTTTDLSGKALEDYTANILGLGDVTGDNFSGMAESAAAMAKSWKLSEEESVNSLDKIFVASQKTNVDAVALTDSLTKYGPALREMGYDMDSSIAMISSWDKAGLDANKMLASMNKVTSSLSKKGVKDLAGGMDELIGKIKNASTEEEANALAIENFGNNGLMMAEAIRSGAFEVDELTKSIAESQGAIGKAGDETETFAEKMDKFKNNVELSLQPIGSNMLDIFGEVLDNAIPIITELSETIGTVFEKISPMIGAALENVMPIVSTLFTFLEDAFEIFESVDVTGVFEMIGDAVQNILPVIIDLAKDLMKFLVPIMNTVIDIAKTVLPVLVTVITRVVGIVGRLIEGLTPVIDMIMPMLSSLIDTVADTFLTLFDAIAPVIEQALPPLMDLISMIVSTILPPFVEIFNQIISSILPPLVSAINSVMTVLEPLIGMFITVAQVVLPPLMEVIKVLANILTTVLGAAFDKISTIVGTVVNVFKGIIDFIKNVFTGNWQGAWDAVKNIFSSIIEGIANIFKTPINFIIRGINFFLGGLNKIKIPDWVPVVGGMGFHVDLIPELAKGTKFFEGGPVIVGEKGPELLTLPTGSKVEPNDTYRRTVSEAVSSDSGKGVVYYNDFSIEITVNADNADDATLQDLRRELKEEIPNAIEEAFEKIYIKVKPA